MFPNKLLNNIFLKQIVKPLYNHYTAGESIINLKQKIVQLHKLQLHPIVDYIKESSNEMTESINEYKNIAKINNLETVAIKLSTFDFNYYHINKIINCLIKENKTVLIDAEDVKCQDRINDITNILIKTYNIDSVSIIKTYQMYRNDSLDLLHQDLNNFPNLGVKLVRGAYYNTDITSGKLFMKKKDTDEAFEKSVKLMFDKIDSNNLYKVFICTHNKKDIDTMINKFNENKEKYRDNVYHGSLYGFINNDTNKIIESGIKTYKYLPYGKIEDSVPYLMRRLYENPMVLIIY